MNKKAKWTIAAVAAIVLQLVLLAAVPAKRFIAEAVGDRVLLRIRPVDPFSIFRGYYMRIGYEISRPESLMDDSVPDGHVYVVLVEGRDGVWEGRSIHSTWPERLPDGAVVIKGRKRRRQINYGIESFYVPEDERHAIEADLRRRGQDALAEIAIGPGGQAVLLSLRVGDRVYDY